MSQIVSVVVRKKSAATTAGDAPGRVCIRKVAVSVPGQTAVLEPCNETVTPFDGIQYFMNGAVSVHVQRGERAPGVTTAATLICCPGYM
jgi:hypothetical protein